MSIHSKYLSAVLIAAALSCSAAGTGCAEHHFYRVYDPYYTDYHRWDNDEIVYYRQWSNETHRDADRDFRRLRPEEQKEYWTWRHNHGDRDHDHGRNGRDKDHRDKDNR